MVIPYMRHEFITIFSQQFSPGNLIWIVVYILPLWWVYKEAKQNHLNPKNFIGLAIAVIIGMFIGNRSFHYLGPWGRGWFQAEGIFNFSQGGYVFYGGLIGAVLAGYLYLKLKKAKNIGRLADLIAPAIALGQFAGRLITCFFIGDDFGTASTLPWALKFLGPGYNYLIGTTIHPVQIYLALGNLLIFVILLELRNKKRWDGWLFTNYILFYGIMRFIIEFFRDTTESTATLIMGVVLTYSQLISLILIAIALYFILKRKSVTTR